MASNLSTSDWIFGVHDIGGEQLFLDAAKPGWIVISEAIGHDPKHVSRADYRVYRDRGFGLLCRLNNGYFPQGTVPISNQYESFARTCAAFVAASSGCNIWIIGNEPNYAIERPTAGAQSMPAPEEAAPAQDARNNTEPPGSPPVETGFWQSIVRLAGSLWADLVKRLQGADAQPGDDKPEPNGPEPTDPAAEVVPVEAAPVSDSSRAGDPLQHGLPARFNVIRGDVPADAAKQPELRAAVASGEVITPDMYARCYRLCRAAIHQIAGHENDQVLVCAVAPWNNQTVYASNPGGNWIQYFQDVLQSLGAGGCDGFVLHTYTHTSDPGLIESEAKLNPPFQAYHYEFRAYQDFLNAVPDGMRQLPVYITETDQDGPWLDQNTGWVQHAYAEIDRWNANPSNQTVRALVLYRWSKFDKWYIDGKQGVMNDLRAALVHDYRWSKTSAMPAFRSGAALKTTTIVNLRRTPGFTGKDANDVVVQLPLGAQVTVLDGKYAPVDGLIWWHVRAGDGAGGNVDGWLAQSAPNGTALLVMVEPGTRTGGTPSFKVGDAVHLLSIVNLRNTPGYTNKQADDVLAQLPIGTSLVIIAGPTNADGLIWWRVKGSTADGSVVEGWMAQSAPNGQPLLAGPDTGVPGGGPGTQPGVTFKPGDHAVTVNYVRLRRSPGLLNKPADDVVADIWQGTPVVILDGPQHADDLIWWHVKTTNVDGQQVQGWMAENAPGNIPLLKSDTGSKPDVFVPGDLVAIADTIVNIRRTPGYTNKADGDILGSFDARTTLYLLAGPSRPTG